MMIVGVTVASIFVGALFMRLQAYTPCEAVDMVYANQSIRLKIWLEMGGDPNSRCRMLSLLEVAAADPHLAGTRSTEILVAAGADLNIRSALSGGTPLIAAADSGRLDVMATLVKAGADVNATDRRGRTALITVADGWVDSRMNAEAVGLLLGAKADVDHRSAAGLTATDYAQRSRNRAFLQALGSVQESSALK